MKMRDFVIKYYPYAIEAEKKSAEYFVNKTGVHHVAILTQAALESGWGEHAPGNMFFGIKDTDGINGNEQLLRTFEYSTQPDKWYKHLISVTPVMVKGKQYYKYEIKAYFRKFDSPLESFLDHVMFFKRNKRYWNALNRRQNPYDFLYAITAAGYATGPEYYDKLYSIAKRITVIIESLKKEGVIS
jgi:flagellum-specific peptidoglycan hydrolase FlgJ